MKSAFLGGCAAIAAGLMLLAPVAQAQDSTKCDRACLEGWVDRYFKAVIDDKPSEVPLSMNVRFTEDGQQLPVGEGLWKSMKAAGKYRLYVADTQAGVIGLLSTVVEDNADPTKGTPAAIALRLRIVNGKIAEIEQNVVRDVKVAERIEALGAPRKQFLTAIPAKERMSRHDLVMTANKYFSGMESNDGKGDYPFAKTCNRIENGRMTTNTPLKEGEKMPDPKTASMYSAHWSCYDQFKSGLLHFVTRIRDRRYVAVDQERGIVMAFGFFDHEAGDTRTYKIPNGKTITAGPAQPWTWYLGEVFKVENGKLDQIEAILQRSPYGMLSGWSSYADGMSDIARDVTGVQEK
jgi:hypothetical protein